MPEQHDPEQELGPKITSAFQDHAGAPKGWETTVWPREARRRVGTAVGRRCRWLLGAMLVVAGAVGGVWGLLGAGESPVATSHKRLRLRRARLWRQARRLHKA